VALCLFFSFFWSSFPGSIVLLFTPPFPGRLRQKRKSPLFFLRAFQAAKRTFCWSFLAFAYLALFPTFPLESPFPRFLPFGQSLPRGIAENVPAPLVPKSTRECHDPSAFKFLPYLSAHSQNPERPLLADLLSLCLVKTPLSETYPPQLGFSLFFNCSIVLLRARKGGYSRSAC